MFSYCTYKKNCCTKQRGAGVRLFALPPVSTTLPKGSTNLFSKYSILFKANASLCSNALQYSRAVKACKKFPPHKERTDKKLFVRLSRFWLLKGVRVNLLKKREIIDKSIFQVRLNEVLRICKK